MEDLNPVQFIVITAAVVAGSFFALVGVLGYIRFPDVYTRLHATSKVGIFGVVFLLTAVIVLMPHGFGRSFILILLLLVAGPATAHAIGSAAYRIGLPMRDAIRDDLARDVERRLEEAGVDPSVVQEEAP